MGTIILSCESLKVYVDAAQQAAGTHYPTCWLQRKYHDDPAQMRMHILETLETLPPDADTVLVAMGFCGGSWDQVTADRRIILPRVDDCITLLLHTDDKYHPNLKHPGHMYMLDGDPKKFSPEKMFDNLCQKYERWKAETVFDMWFENYHFLDVIDTGMFDCYSEDFAAQAQRSADLIHCALDYVPGSNLMLEKLMRGEWDEQFIIAEPGHKIVHKDFFE